MFGYLGSLKTLFLGLFENTFLGSVFAEDEDDWDFDNKTFAFEDENTAKHFRYKLWN